MSVLITSMLSYEPDLLDATNKNMHGESQWVTWNIVSSQIIFKLICHHVAAHV